MKTSLKRFLIDALVAVLSAVVTFLGTVTFSSCGSTWKIDALVDVARLPVVEVVETDEEPTELSSGALEQR